MSLKFVGRLIAVVSLAILISGCAKKEKEELEASYRKELEKMDWKKWENKLKRAYDQLNWNKINEETVQRVVLQEKGEHLGGTSRKDWCLNINVAETACQGDPTQKRLCEEGTDSHRTRAP